MSFILKNYILNKCFDKFMHIFKNNFFRTLYIYFFNNVPLDLFTKFEFRVALLQGKGWGGNTIKKEISACLSLLKEKPKIFIDIGANKGLYTEYLTSQIPSISCHLFEPSEKNIK